MIYICSVLPIKSTPTVFSLKVYFRLLFIISFGKLSNQKGCYHELPNTTETKMKLNKYIQEVYLFLSSFRWAFLVKIKTKEILVTNE